jgi:ATP synthase assembly factor FMC1
MPPPSPPPSRALHLYRALLRTLPSTASPQLRARLRAAFDPASPTYNPSSAAAAEQFAAYLRAQRVHAGLLARYNPGLDMAQDERVRLSARRVGLDMPSEHEDEGKDGR